MNCVYAGLFVDRYGYFAAEHPQLGPDTWLRLQSQLMSVASNLSDLHDLGSALKKHCLLTIAYGIEEGWFTTISKIRVKGVLVMGVLKVCWCKRLNVCGSLA